MSEIFAKFAEMPLATWIALACMAVFAIALFALTPKVKWNARMLALAALCIAGSFVLSYIRLYRMPQGGSITPASMLPVMFFCFAFGFGPGLLCALAYSVLQMFQDMYIVNWIQASLDYILAFSALALVALFRGWKSPLAFPFGVVVAGLVRIAMHVISGVVYFGEYVPEGMNPLVYSLGYNLSSVGVDALICMVIAFIPAVRNLAVRLAAPRNLASRTD